MKKLALIAALMCGASTLVMAQSYNSGTPSTSAGTMGSPTNPPSANTMGDSGSTVGTMAPTGQAASGNTPPLTGANSFTKKEAMHRLKTNGYTNIAGLAKDSQSVWRGTAMKDGQRVTVALDYRGNITEASSGSAGSSSGSMGSGSTSGSMNR